jgi:flavin-dependent thymidylate synthase
MNVTLINPDEVKKLIKNWGEIATVCYNTNPKYSQKVGEHCLEAKHFSGSRGEYIKFNITGVSRAIIDQMIRAEQGCVKNVQSTRYVNLADFSYHTPKKIQKDEILNQIWTEHMETTKQTYSKIQSRMSELGYKGETINENARGILPLDHHSAVNIGFTLEALINYMGNRLCTRTQDGHRQLAIAMRKAVLEVVPELKDHLVVKCVRDLYCTESHSCGLYPKKDELLKIIEAGKEKLEPEPISEQVAYWNALNN